VALIGNPNAGKTTLFNVLTGARQKVGNWPGVTIEKKEGSRRFRDVELTFIDLPGTYSLSSYSLEETVVRDYLLGEKPDVVVQVVDASNLERNLYLAVQLLELGVPLVMALNMWDEFQGKGFKLNLKLLCDLLGCEIVPTIGSRGFGVEALLDAVLNTATRTTTNGHMISVNYGLQLESEVAGLSQRVAQTCDLDGMPSRWLALRLLEGDQEMLVRVTPELSQYGDLREELEAATTRLNRHFPEGVETLIADRRYGFIAGALQETLTRSVVNRREMSEHVDRILTNRMLGMPLFLLFLWLLFQATFTLGAAPQHWIGSGVDAVGGLLARLLPAGPLNDLVVDGIIGGVGGVLVFLPNILILFLGISILEDTGYMARAAFLMDKLMHMLGLHGKSFIPLIMGFGCGVPAIMATRALESRRDRLLTILLIPLMSCSARLPVYILFAGAFFPRHAGNVIFLLYIFGVVAAIGAGKLFSLTLLRSKGAPFVMELPPYRIPTLRASLMHMWDRGSQYLRKMGTIILAASVIVWFVGAFPRVDGQKPPAQDSYVGQFGRAISPALDPLGFDWQMGVSLLTGLVAKEVVVSTMGVLYGVGDQAQTENGEVLPNALKNSGITPISALAFMFFVLLYSPCLAAITAIWRETGSWRWTLFSVGYQTVLAWGVALIVVNLDFLVGWMI
jgi:ferrous iron transport protein B